MKQRRFVVYIRIGRDVSKDRQKSGRLRGRMAKWVADAGRLSSHVSTT
jgi:hypothetical protein